MLFENEATCEYFFKNGTTVLNKLSLHGIRIENAKEVNAQWLIEGTSGFVLVVIGTGQTMMQAQAQVYSRIKNIMIANLYHRTDIGCRQAEDFDTLYNEGNLRSNSGECG